MKKKVKTRILLVFAVYGLLMGFLIINLASGVSYEGDEVLEDIVRGVLAFGIICLVTSLLSIVVLIFEDTWFYECITYKESDLKTLTHFHAKNFKNGSLVIYDNMVDFTTAPGMIPKEISVVKNYDYKKRYKDTKLVTIWKKK